MWWHVQAEGEVQAQTKRVRQLEEEFEQTESRLQAASEKLDQATKAADESERSVTPALSMMSTVHGVKI